MTDEAEIVIPSFQVEQISVTEKLRRRRYEEDRTRALRRGTWIVGSWSCYLVAIGSVWYWEGTERGKFAALMLFGLAGLTSLFSLHYAIKVGFYRSIFGKMGMGELHWSDIVWVALWSSLVGGTLGLAATLTIPRQHPFLVIACTVAAFVLSATIGNRVARRKYPRAQR